jgi:hypothetical protein
MTLANKTRFIAAASLTALVTATPALAQNDALQAGSVQLSEAPMGKEIRVEDVLKGRQTGKTGGLGKTGKTGKTGKPGKTGKAAGGGSQTARKPTEGGSGDEGGFGVERPAPEGPDPNEVTGGGERPLDGGGGSGGKHGDAPPDDS